MTHSLLLWRQVLNIVIVGISLERGEEAALWPHPGMDTSIVTSTREEEPCPAQCQLTWLADQAPGPPQLPPLLSERDQSRETRSWARCQPYLRWWLRSRSQDHTDHTTPAIATTSWSLMTTTQTGPSTSGTGESTRTGTSESIRQSSKISQSTLEHPLESQSPSLHQDLELNAQSKIQLLHPHSYLFVYCRTLKPDFLLVRQNLRDANENYKNLLLAFKYAGGVPSVNSLESIYNFQVNTEQQPMIILRISN